MKMDIPHFHSSQSSLFFSEQIFSQQIHSISNCWRTFNISIPFEFTNKTIDIKHIETPFNRIHIVSLAKELKWTVHYLTMCLQWSSFTQWRHYILFIVGLFTGWCHQWEKVLHYSQIHSNMKLFFEYLSFTMRGIQTVDGHNSHLHSSQISL